MKKATLPVVGHVGPAQRGDRMEAPHALAALAALGSRHGLKFFSYSFPTSLMVFPPGQ